MTDILKQLNHLSTIDYKLIEEELEQLRKDKETWQKVCNYEKSRYQRMFDALKGSTYGISEETKEHIKNINELAGDK